MHFGKNLSNVHVFSLFLESSLAVISSSPTMASLPTMSLLSDTSSPSQLYSEAQSLGEGGVNAEVSELMNLLWFLCAGSSPAV